MSNFVLGIFDNLGGYLTAVLTECNGSSVASCSGPDKSFNRYYLQKYYGNNGRGSRDDDVAAEFTNAVVDLGQKLRAVDVSTSVVSSLKSALLEALNKYVNDLDVKSDGSTLSDGLSGSISGNNVLNVKLADVPALKSALLNTVDSLGLSAEERSVARDKVNDLNLNVTTTVYFTGDAAASASKQKILNKLTDVLVSSLNKTYTTERVTGTTPAVAKALTALKNGQVSDIEMQLFNEYLTVMKKSGDSWVSASASEISGDLSSFRLNVKVVDMDVLGKVPTVATSMPVLETKNRVWYSGAEVAMPSSKYLLAEVLTRSYRGDDIKKTLDKFKLGGTVKLNPDLVLLMKNVLEATYVPEAHIDESNVEQIDSVLRNTWKRVGTNSWVHTLGDGTQVTIAPGTPEYEEEIRREISNCGAIGFGNDAVKCKQFLENVALSNSEKLAEVASSMSQDVSAQVVADLHPKFALAVLKAFGFHRKMCKDRVSGRQLEKVQRADEWKVKFVDTKFSKPVADGIKANAQLINFLDLLAQLVNANPSVLNDGLVVETEESTGTVVVPEDLAARKITAAKSKASGKPVLGWNEIQSNMNKIYGSFSRGLTFDGLSTNSPFGMDNLFPQMSLLTSAPVVRGSTWGSMMLGGGSEKVFQQDHQTGLEYSRNIQKIIGELVKNLENSNKTLTDEEKRTIAKKMRDFEVLERELFETAWNIQKYSQLLKVVEAESRPEIISYKHIEKYVEKYNHLLSRYERNGNSFNTLISLLKDCCDGGEGEGCKTL
jgi:hypothetical protein